jgi:tyrosine decarboxylase / aspartate 1-decarboxylase
LRPKGLTKTQVITELKKALMQDSKYSDGRILCSMCTRPHPIAKTAGRLFLESNLGDPGLFLGSLKLEREVIKKLATLLNGENSVGFLVSGGTEANLMALLAARNTKNISKPEVVLPKSAHFSFIKICGLLGLKPVYASLDDSHRVSIASVEKHLTAKTVAVVGSAGTAELGMVDPVDKLSEIAVKHEVYLHVDAAFGGLIIPFLEPRARGGLVFDFQLEGVKSVTVDPHKMGMTTLPAGGILFRNDSYLEFIKTETPYLTEKHHHTIVGTRTGAAAAATWAVFELLGCEGFQKVIKQCMKLTRLLAKKLEEFGYSVVVQPTLNIVGFRSSNSSLLYKKLLMRGWLVSYVPRIDCIRIVIMPHTKRRHILDFLRDLRDVDR